MGDDPFHPMTFAQADGPSAVGMSDAAESSGLPTYETADVTFTQKECHAALRQVLDEVERYERRNIPIDGVIIPVPHYTRLYTLVWEEAGPHVEPTKESVEEYVGVNLYVTDFGLVRAVPSDTRRLMVEWVHGDLPHRGPGDRDA